MKRDLTGQRFGSLLVVEPTEQRSHGAVLWRCRCDCGREVIIESRRLRAGLISSCGCREPDIPADLTGRRFGRLTVAEKTEKRTKNRSVLWRCRCDCGGEIETTRDKLLSGGVSSCGCGRQPPLKDWVGRRFGKLTVEAYAGKEKGAHLWRCRCDCGTVVTVRQSNLQSGCTASCGCGHDPTAILHFVDGTCVERLRPRALSKANTSGVRGVYYDRTHNSWAAQIMFRRKCYYLGRYATLEEAAKARRRGEEMHDAFLDWYDHEFLRSGTASAATVGEK